MTARDNVVFLLDCDNTLLDNDLVQDDLRDHLAREFGPASRDEYWAILERLRSELGYADYLGALQRYRLGDLSDTRLLLMSTYLVDYPFASRLYPGALDPHNLAAHPAADLTVERIGDLRPWAHPRHGFRSCGLRTPTDRHWHGATASTAMTHIAIQEGRGCLPASGIASGPFRLSHAECHWRGE